MSQKISYIKTENDKYKVYFDNLGAIGENLDKDSLDKVLNWIKSSKLVFSEYNPPDHK